MEEIQRSEGLPGHHGHAILKPDALEKRDGQNLTSRRSTARRDESHTRLHLNSGTLVCWCTSESSVVVLVFAPSWLARCPPHSVRCVDGTLAPMAARKSSKSSPGLTALKREAAQLWRELARAPAGDLVGVVQPKGVGGGKLQGEKDWTLQIPLLAWRFDGGPLRKEALVVRKRVTERGVAAMIDRLGDYEVVRMRVRVAEENITGTPQAMLVRMIGRVDDAEMLKAVGRLKNPAKIKTRRLGDLKLNPASGELEGRVEWNGRRPRLTLEPDRRGRMERSIERAEWLAGTVAARRIWQGRIERKILATAYEDWKKTWRLADDKVLPPERFLKKLKLTAISMGPDGAFSFWYDDGDLFAGHAVVVRGNVSRGVQEATVKG